MTPKNMVATPAEEFVPYSRWLERKRSALAIRMLRHSHYKHTVVLDLLRDTQPLLCDPHEWKDAQEVTRAIYWLRYPIANRSDIGGMSRASARWKAVWDCEV